jgi:hypothetical protein
MLFFIFYNDDKLCTHIHNTMSISRLHLNVSTYFILLRANLQLLYFLSFASQYFAMHLSEDFFFVMIFVCTICNEVKGGSN